MPAAGVAGGASGPESNRASSPSSKRWSTACSTRTSHGLIGVAPSPAPQESSTSHNFLRGSPGKCCCSFANAPASLLIAGSELIWILRAGWGGTDGKYRMFSRASRSTCAARGRSRDGKLGRGVGVASSRLGRAGIGQVGMPAHPQSAPTCHSRGHFPLVLRHESTCALTPSSNILLSRVH